MFLNCKQAEKEASSRFNEVHEICSCNVLSDSKVEELVKIAKNSSKMEMEFWKNEARIWREKFQALEKSLQKM